MATNHKPVRLFLILIVLTLFASGAFGSMYDVQIEGKNGITGSSVSIPVSFSPGLNAMHGFEFLVEYDATALAFVGVTPGEPFDIPGLYEWEYFASSNESSGLIRMVGLAETADGEHHPVSVLFPDYMVLFSIEFEVIAGQELEFSNSPIRFYWEECADNAIAPDSLGETLAMSNHVYDWVGYNTEITDFSFGLPGIYGAPDTCLTSSSISREINYFGGGVTILPADTSSFRGDLNCNGIQYEIADWVMYASYFIHGLVAFGEHPNCSIAASDINGDGYVLTVADYVYLLRVIIGDDPNPSASLKQNDVVATFTQDVSAGTVSFDYPDSLAAMHLIFNGEITPTLLLNVEGISMSYGFDDGLTRVFVGPSFPGPVPLFVTTGGPFLSYTGSAPLIYVDAGDYEGTIFEFNIEILGGDFATPYGFKIDALDDVVQGTDISIPVTKTAGSEKMSGFDILIGYDNAAMSIQSVSPGTPFDIPGVNEWEYFTYRFGPFECDGDCPSGLLRVVGVADIPNGAHNPLDVPIPDGTVLFNLDCQVSTNPEFEGLFIPVSFFWIDCGDNAVAYGDFGDSLALSQHVYDHNGVEITNPNIGFPGYWGAHEFCFEQGANPPTRLANFSNGGVQVVGLETMALIVTIDDAIAFPGDTAIYLDVRLSNPQDSIVGFLLTIQLDTPELAEFGFSETDSISINVENSMISGWEFIHTQSLSGLFHDLRIVGFANNIPPYTNSIPPQSDGLLFRLVLHVYDSIPELAQDSTVNVLINDQVTWTQFSDPQGNLIGLSEGAYDPQVVSFNNGSLTIENYLYGDANNDESVNVGDAVFLINHVFKGGPAPDPLQLGETNCDGIVNVGDAVFLINFVFKGGAEPSCQ